jgi:hypothetical protein
MGGGGVFSFTVAEGASDIHWKEDCGGSQWEEAEANEIPALAGN